MTIQNIIFIDSQVSGYEALIANFSSTPQTQCYLLHADEDGLLQIQQLLAGYTDLNSIQIISHGAPGSLQLGNIVLNQQQLPHYQNQLKAIGSSLNANGDLLLYGCNVAQGEVGLNFINALAQSTAADVAASDDLTGPDGNVLLEVATGSIETSVLELTGLTTSLAAPTGTVTITGTPTQGQVLTASNTLADADGLGSISYQWYAGNVAINGATGSALVLGQEQVGKAIRVTANYMDGAGNAESVASTATSSVVNINDAPTGNVILSGTAKQGETLTASHNLEDADGLGSISYQWLANGTSISDATSSTFQLGLDQVGKTISVKLSYTDGAGYAESKTSAATSAVQSLTAVDQIAPILTATLPTDGQTKVAVTSTIQLTFSEPIQKGTGTIYFVLDDGSEAIALNVLGSNVTIQSNKLSIKLSTPLLQGKNYTIVIGAGVVTDLSGNAYAGISDYNFSTEDKTPPSIASYTPVDGATGVLLNENLIFTFSEAVQKGAGVIELRQNAPTGALIESFNVLNSTRLTWSEDSIQLTVDPVSNLLEGTKYFLVFPAGAVKDGADNANALVNTYDFTTIDTFAPVVLEKTPVPGATKIAIASNITFTFNELIKKGVGVVELRMDGSDVAVETFDVATSSRLRFNGKELIIDPTASLLQGKNYSVSIPEGAIQDLSGNSYIASDYDINYRFTTLDTVAPTVTMWSPSDGATAIATHSNISLAFSEPVQFGVGPIQLRLQTATGPVVESFNTGVGGNATFDENNILTLDPWLDLNPNTTYFLTIPNGAIKDMSGNAYIGTIAYDFTTAPDTVAPIVRSFVPGNNTTGVPLDSGIDIIFNEKILPGTGSIEIRSGSRLGPVVESFNVANSPYLQFTNNMLTILPQQELEPQTRYFVVLPRDSIKDATGNFYLGTSTYNFVTADTIAPTAVAFAPNDGATGVPVHRPIEVTFSELVKMSSGKIELRLGNSPTGTLVESVDITNQNQVSIVDNMLKVTWLNPLALDKNYFVHVPAGVVKDMSGNLFQGLNYQFKTTNNPSNLFFSTPAPDVFYGTDAIETAVYAAPYQFFQITRVGSSHNWHMYGDGHGDDLLKEVERVQFADKKIALDVDPDQHTGQALQFWTVMNPALIHAPDWLGMVVGLFDAGHNMLAVFNWAMNTINNLIGPVSDEMLVAWVEQNLSEFSLWTWSFDGWMPIINSEEWYSLVDELYSNDDSNNIPSQIDFLVGVAALDIHNPEVAEIRLTGIEYL
jgi:methionine-rich copper-binding protein CopC